MITIFHLPTKIIFGSGSIASLGEEAQKLGKKAIIVTYPDIKKVGILIKIVDGLKAKKVYSVVFDEVEPNPHSTTVDKGAEIVRREQIDLIIGLGGGSAMDAAKGIALASSSTESIWQYWGVTIEPKGPVRPIIQVPTMAGTGSEANPSMVITNWEKHEKVGLGHPSLFAQVSIVDPEVTLSVPKRQTAAGGVDIFSHLVEYYLMPESPLPLNDGIREALLRVVVKYLPRVLAKLDDIEARTQLSWASTIAMSQLARLGGTAGAMSCHGLEHALSGYYDVTHGVGLATLLPVWMRNILPVRKERLDLLGKNVFGKTDGIKATEEWLEEVGMSFKLRDFGFKLEHAEEVAENALRTSRGIAQHPIKLEVETVAQIYKDAY
ncbi:MAG: iron-containing alcohol dehydrogenase [Dehalococcoidales bacterium]|nr:iron-containing alcohol dehydrogenase [Dehalococcoidales bacterium]